MAFGYPKALQNAKLLAAQQNPQYNYGIQLTGGKDPYNWTGIAAQLAKQKKQEQTKKSAQNRVQASAKVNRGNGGGGAAVEEAPPAPNYMLKADLDAYRAANGGALPPGISAEMAALIDQGIDLAGLQTTNPAAFNSLLAIQASIAGLPSAYDASKAKITADYDRLTGDVTTAGQDFMKNMYGNVVDPNDPNAAAFAADPAFAQYANTLGQIGETGDVNEATDLAWFEKNQQAQQSYLQNLIQGVQSGLIPVGDEIGGGGGGGGGGGYGGGGRRGYGGGSGYGNGDNEWTDPKTTSTRTDQLKDVAAETGKFFNPDLWAGIEAAAVDEEQAAAFYELYTKYGQQPIPIQKGLSEERHAVEEKLAELAAQEIARTSYEEMIPQNTSDLISQWRENMGYERDPEAGPRWVPNAGGVATYEDNYKVPEGSEASGRIQDAEMSKLNEAAGKMQQLAAQSDSSSAAANAFGNRGWGGGNNIAQKAKELASRQAKARLRANQEAYDKEAYDAEVREWEKNNTADNPFPIGNWRGYIPAVSPEDKAEAELHNRNIFDLSAAIYGLDPNISPQRTQLSTTTTGTQTDQLQTKQSTYDPNAALGGNLQEIYGAGVGTPMSPFMGGMSSPSYQFDDQPLPQYDDETGEYEDPITGVYYGTNGLPQGGIGLATSSFGGGPRGHRIEAAGNVEAAREKLRNRALATTAAKRLGTAHESGRGWGRSLSDLLGTNKFRPPKKVEEIAPPVARNAFDVPAGITGSAKPKAPKKTVTPPKKAAAPKSERSIGSASSTAPLKPKFPVKPKATTPPKKAPKKPTPPKPKKPKATVIRF